MLTRADLVHWYVEKKMSVSVIARRLKCSEGRVNYWLAKRGIAKRTISEAIYHQRNPKGDPFSFTAPKTSDEAFLLGLGTGLYWGEGTKKSASVRLGNSDPRLIKMFIRFLTKVYNVPRNRLRFGLQIFGDMNSRRALRFWQEELEMPKERFYTPIVTPHRGIGSYRQKTQYGVLTLYFNNRKLRDILCRSIEDISV